MAAGMDVGRLSIDKLETNNWSTWKFQIKHMLLSKDLWKHVTGTMPVGANDAAIAEWNGKVQMALACIVLSISSSQLYLVTSCDTAQEAWKALCEHYECNTLGNKLILKKQYFRMEMSETQSVETHLKEMKLLTERLASIDCAVSEEDQVVTLLGSLPKSYQNFVTSLETRGDDLKLSYVQQALVYEEKKRKGFGIATTTDGMEESALLANKKNFKCHYCGKPGHMKKHCFKLKREKSKSESASMAKGDEVCDFAFTTAQYFSGWCIDSGATSHICNNEKLFKSLDKSKNEFVTVANGNILKSEGRGECLVRCTVNNHTSSIPIKNVMFAPEAPCNLLSVKCITDKGLKVIFENDKCQVLFQNKIVALGELNGNLYELQEEKVLAAKETSRCVHEWHLLLAHKNIHDIRKMNLNIKQCNCSDICEHCIKGKMATKPFPKKSSEVNNMFDVVVSDVCGPFQVESVGRAKYFVTFIDVYSRYSKVYFMRNKSDVFEKLREFVENVKTKFHLKPKVVRSDRGGEYLNENVQKYLKSEGIEFQCTVGYAPQQNGIAERKNRSLVEAARTMLSDSGLAKCWWAEAINTANYVQNNTFSSVLNCSPYEKLFGESPKMNDLHKFGEPVYAKIPDVKRRKLDDKAEKLVFVGYDMISNGYRLGDVTKNKVIISRDVKFLCDKVYVDLNLDLDSDIVDEDVESENESVHDVENNDQVHENVNDEINLRRSSRENQGKLPSYLNDYHVFSAIEPNNLKEVENSSEKDEWFKAMNEELKSIHENETWDLVDLPEGKSVIGCKWFKMFVRLKIMLLTCLLNH